jgi:hypothetical protein
MLLACQAELVEAGAILKRSFVQIKTRLRQAQADNFLI